MPSSPSDSVLKELRAFGLSFPGAHTKAPWPDHMDLAVNNKTFAYLSVEGEPLSISCKLPWSSATALVFPFVEPTAYGLGESGWVTARFSEDELPPIDTLKAWVDESYRAQAPKRLISRIPSSLKLNTKSQAAASRTGAKRGAGTAAGTGAGTAKRAAVKDDSKRAIKSSSTARSSQKVGTDKQLTAAGSRKAAAKKADARTAKPNAKKSTKQNGKSVTKSVKAVKAPKRGAQAARKRK
jgi:hypothetical protein